jgi:hypothetical protein
MRKIDNCSQNHEWSRLFCMVSAHHTERPVSILGGNMFIALFLKGRRLNMFFLKSYLLYKLNVCLVIKHIISILHHNMALPQDVDGGDSFHL